MTVLPVGSALFSRKVEFVYKGLPGIVPHDFLEREKRPS